MSLVTLWEAFADKMVYIGLPVVAGYHLLCANPFLNVSATDAKGLEKVANVYLAPAQYLLAGRKANPIFSDQNEIVGYKIEQRFNYQDPWIWVKTTASYLALPSSLVIGGGMKGLSYFSEKVRKKHEKISSSFKTAPFLSQNSLYRSLGMDVGEKESIEFIESLGYERRPGDEKTLEVEKKALQEIIALFDQYDITYWLDCGTCLGAYRYGGIIPWDWDIDMAILQPDFDRAYQVLQNLDPEKYLVQDWSSRDRPKSYLKVYVKETRALIDIYHFSIDPMKKVICSILSNENSVFLPESWKIRERRCVMDTPFDFVFPLKKAFFDGIEVSVPNQVEKYLEQRYGDITPVKVYSSETGEYEKDLNHPYWKLPFTK